MPAIGARKSIIFAYVLVLVGDFNKSVSEMMAEINKPAICFGITMPFSINIFVIMVAVEPNGSFLKYSGNFVSTLATLWWSMISRISASSMSSTD